MGEAREAPVSLASFTIQYDILPAKPTIAEIVLLYRRLKALNVDLFKHPI